MRSWYSRARKYLHDAGRKRAAAAHARAIEAAKRRGLPAPTAPVVQTGESRLRQGYTLLRSILATAVRHGLIGSNPCQITGAGAVAHPELTALTEIPHVRPHRNSPPRVASAHEGGPPSLLMVFDAHLRPGELVALQRGGDGDGVLRVERQTTLVNGKPVTTPTKTGTARTVVLPPSVAAEGDALVAVTRVREVAPIPAHRWGADHQSRPRAGVEEGGAEGRARAVPRSRRSPRRSDDGGAGGGDDARTHAARRTPNGAGIAHLPARGGGAERDHCGGARCALLGCHRRRYWHGDGTRDDRRHEKVPRAVG